MANTVVPLRWGLEPTVSTDLTSPFPGRRPDLSTAAASATTGNEDIGNLNIGLCDQLTVARPALFRGGRDQLTVGVATNLPWITFPVPPVIHRRPPCRGATNLP